MPPLADTREPVRTAVWYCLDNYCYEDAVFLAERLHAEVGSVDTSYLLATCYYRSGRVQQAKHLLSKEGVVSHSHCSLLYAQCCLSLKDYKSGLVALQGLLCVKDMSEADYVRCYGNDTGVAFHLLGMLNLRLNQTKEAVKHFRAALKYNPFLWSAFEKLCDLGEGVPASDVFTLFSIPTFLQQHSTHSYTHPPPSQPHNSHAITHQPSTAPKSLPSTKSAFTPVPSSVKQPYMTPDLFAQPTLGKAMASSTPSAPRTLSFMHDPIPFRLSRDTLSVEGAGKGHTHSQLGMLTDSKMATSGGLGVVRGALDFGSSTGGSGRGVSKAGVLTPFTPSFGVLPHATPPSMPSNEVTGLPQALDFDSVTPSPTALPEDYLSTIASAPKSNKGKRSFSYRRSELDVPMISEEFEDTPSPEEEGSEFTHPLMQSTSVTSSTVTVNQTAGNCGERSHDTVTTPPRSHLRSPGRTFRVPAAPKSGLSIRRSARLAASKRELGPHSVRVKSRGRAGNLARRSLDPSSKKVTFSSAAVSREGSRDDRQPPSTKAARLATPKHTPYSKPSPSQHLSAENVLQGQNENVRESVKSGGVRSEGVRSGGVRSEGVRDVESEETLAQRQAEMEQAAMAGLTSLMHLLCKLGSAYQSLALYNLEQAVQQFETIPTHHYSTAWVTDMVARAHFAREDFKQSAKLYGEVHHMDPHRQEGMELYASALWHLQKDVQLSVVAETLHTSNKTSPQALCAMSSVMNRYKDHVSAVKYLQRAIQVCPQFEYAHTLLGHEYWLTKDFDKALSAFQESITINPRHFNGWYGLSHVYFTQEKYMFAENYANRALAINKCSSIACTQMALTQFHRNHYQEALATLNRAIVINPTNPIPKFHRAKVLEVLDRPEEALKQLDQLSISWPKEPNLYVTKGKILRKLNRVTEAILHFSWARDFGKTEGNSQIRDEIDHVYRTQGEGGDEDAELGSFVLDEDVDMESEDSAQG